MLPNSTQDDNQLLPSFSVSRSFQDILRYCFTIFFFFSFSVSLLCCTNCFRGTDYCQMYPHHFSLCMFTVLWKSSYHSIVYLILFFTPLLMIWSLYKMPHKFQNHFISVAHIFFFPIYTWYSPIHNSQAYKNIVCVCLHSVVMSL